MSESDNLPEPAGWDDEDRPWERPGGFRRDYPPHRAPLLRAVGLAALALGLASLCCPLLAALTAWPALGVSLVACMLAHRDLRAMEDRRMDPAGIAAALRCRENGVTGALLAVLALLVVAIVGVFAGLADLKWGLRL